MDLTDTLGPVTYAYTRAQAIADGVLVDVTATAKEAGFAAPVALTRAAWVDTVQWDETNPEPQDEDGRLWDLPWMASNAARMARGAAEVTFEVLRIANHGPERQWAAAELVRLRMVIGAGDTAAPVITVMLPGED